MYSLILISLFECGILNTTQKKKVKTAISFFFLPKECSQNNEVF